MDVRCHSPRVMLERLIDKLHAGNLEGRQRWQLGTNRQAYERVAMQMIAAA